MVWYFYMSNADTIRAHVLRRHVEPARRDGKPTVAIVAGDIHRELGLEDRVPSVCSALRARKFLDANDLELEDVRGPKSSTTTTFTYRLRAVGGGVRPARNPVWNLLGAGTRTLAALGGGERWLRQEREAFRGADPPGAAAGDAGRPE